MRVYGVVDDALSPDFPLGVEFEKPRLAVMTREQREIIRSRSTPSYASA